MRSTELLAPLSLSAAIFLTVTACAEPPALLVAPFSAEQAKTAQQAWAKHVDSQVERNNSLDMKLVLVPPGEFVMGLPKSEKGNNDHVLEHRVRITKPFYLGIYEVTQGEYKRLTSKNPSQFRAEGEFKVKLAESDTRRFPVESVTWDEAVEFCELLSKQEGKKYRLPTEAEWEYACRAGTRTPFSFGDTLNGTDANSCGEAPFGTETPGPYLHQPREVGSYRPNAFGLYDMHGNVWELCADRYSSSYYKESPVDDPPGKHRTREIFSALRYFGGEAIAAIVSTAVPDSGPIFSISRVCLTSGSASSANRNHEEGSMTIRPVALLIGLGLAACLAVDRVSAADAPPLLVAPFDAAQAKSAQDGWAKSLDAKIELTNSLGMKLVLIPPGEFQMGGPFEEDIDSRFEDNHHEHHVRISRPFYLGVYEVTLGQFLAFYRDGNYQARWGSQGKGQSSGVIRNEEKLLPDKQDFYDFADGEAYVPWKWGHPSQTEKHPVVGVSWNDAVAFCDWLSKKEKKIYRLPSEAEWEYACRAGTTTRFYNGDEESRLSDVANFVDATHLAEFLPAQRLALNDGFAFTAPTGQFKPNAFGLFDMHGNAAEWCRDWYGADYFSQSPVDDPQGPVKGLFRVVRGGSWNNHWSGCRSASRWTGAEWLRSCCNGFRVVCEP